MLCQSVCGRGALSLAADTFKGRCDQCGRDAVTGRKRVLARKSGRERRCVNCAQPARSGARFCDRCEALDEIVASSRRALKALGDDRPLEQHVSGLLPGIMAIRNDGLAALSELTDRKARPVVKPIPGLAPDPPLPTVRRPVNQNLRVFRGAITPGERTVLARRQALSHSWIFWIADGESPDGEMSRVVFRHDNEQIGHIYFSSACPGRIFSVDLEGRARTHKKPFNAVRALEGFAKKDTSKTRCVDSSEVAFAKARWLAEQHAKQAEGALDADGKAREAQTPPSRECECRSFVEHVPPAIRICLTALDSAAPPDAPEQGES